MNHVSTKTVESTAFPGVRFVLKRMTKRRADALDELQAGIRDRLSPLNEEFLPLNEEFLTASRAALALVQPDRDKLIAGGMSAKDAAKQCPLGKIEFAEDRFRRWMDLEAQINKIDQYEATPIAARFCLVRIEELDITYPNETGEDVTAPATLDLVMQHGPDELYAEILHEIKRECGLLPEEVQELKSPSTLVAVDTGKSPTGNATVAGNSETTTFEAVASSTDPASVAA